MVKVQIFGHFLADEIFDDNWFRFLNCFTVSLEFSEEKSKVIKINVIYIHYSLILIFVDEN